jgi:type II restriction/modification system DNA methylase subunit YeeA
VIDAFGERVNFRKINMETSKLRKFASFARSALIEQVGTRMKTVLAEQSLARRESPKVVEELEKKIKDLGEKRVLEMVAYTWFNRFCALRYMDVNRYTRIGVLSPADGQFQPEILSEAKMGHIDEELVPEATRNQVMRLLDGSDKSIDPQGEAYRLLLVAVCNHYHSIMPFMFERIADYTELLLPDDLLSGTSIPAYTREALLPINCSPEHTEESVEVIGWLYQFYIADKKDEVFEGLKKGKKITAENIPAATQLFTPHWIVRYLVENSLGRLWMLNHPESKLTDRMDYYIKPEEPETDFLKISSPEEIKVCDPACGSGHMLTYAFDLLYEIYREEQYPEPEIPSLILRNNLYGIEIDPRAGALAAFALTMKAREKDKRFFTRKPQSDASARGSSSIENSKSRIQNPNICVLENIKIDPDDLSAYMDKVGRDLFTGGLQDVVNQWEESDNFGSLIRPLVTDVREVLELLRVAAVDEDLFLADAHQKVLKALRQADFLSPRYHVVVANPPYMGGKHMTPRLKELGATEFKDVKSDLYSMFVVRFLELAVEAAFIGIMSPFTWMFLSSFEKLRNEILNKATITALVRPEYHAFFDSAYVPICGFVLLKRPLADFQGTFIDLNQFYGVELQPIKTREAIQSETCSWKFRASSVDFAKIEGSPIVYWVSDQVRQIFKAFPPLKEIGDTRQGMATSDNNRFLRTWSEVSISHIKFDAASREEALKSGCYWFPYNKGGDFRKWFGNHEYVVDWKNDGEALLGYASELYGSPTRTIKSISEYFKPSISWSKISSANLAMRYFPQGFIFDVAGCSIFANSQETLLSMLGYVNTNMVRFLLSCISPTLNFEAGQIAQLPYKFSNEPTVVERVRQLIEVAKDDWDSLETSWAFRQPPLFHCGNGTLQDVFETYRNETKRKIASVSELETENNRFFAEFYGLSGEFEVEVPSEQLTLSCNPAYRFGSDKSDSELEALLLADTMREIISYAVGCMFGRYSLDKAGLILANQGETADDYRQLIPAPTFAPDEDNVIPILEGEWFSDDISQRFKDFLKVTFGTEHYNENLEYLENSLYPDNPTAKKRKTIRDYFLKDFYDHHLKMYKKRPIYWLFSSPKGTFNALIYMHRYRPETVGKVLECLRDFRDKLAHHAEHRQMTADSANASKTEKTQAVKEVAAIKKQLKELEDYEKTLFEVAAKKSSIDLDDGVKHNYPLFGSVLRKIPGLDAKDD